MFVFVCIVALATAVRIVPGGAPPTPLPGVTGTVADLRAALKTAGSFLLSIASTFISLKVSPLCAGCDGNCKQLDTRDCPGVGSFGPGQALSTLTCDASGLVTDLCGESKLLFLLFFFVVFGSFPATLTPLIDLVVVCRTIASVDDLANELDLSAMRALSTLSVVDCAHVPALTLAVGKFALRTLTVHNASSLAKLVNVEQSARLQTLALSALPSLAPFALPPSLTSLRVRACKSLDALELDAAPNLLTLALVDMPSLAVVNLTSVVRLESLTLSGTGATPIAGLESLVALQELSLGALTLPKTLDLGSLLVSYRQLYSLHVDGVVALTSLDVASLSLHSLYVGGRVLGNLTGLDTQLALNELVINGTDLRALNVASLPLLNSLRIANNAKLANVVLLDLPLLDEFQISDR